MDSRPSEQTRMIDPADRGMIETVSVTEVVQRTTGFVRRQYPVFVFVTATAVALGLVYLFTTPARYTAHASLLVASDRARILQQSTLGASAGDIPVDTAQVETQLELLKSDDIGLAVIKDQQLTEDPEFLGAGGGLFGRIFGFVTGLLSSPAPKSETALTRTALAIFKANRVVKRVGLTYVIDIAYTSLDADKAARVANAIADAYIIDQLDSKYQVTKRASKWLQDRIAELRTQAAHADRAVLEYKEKNHIVEIGANPTSGVGSHLLGDQQLSELTAELSKARSQSAEAKAKLDRILEIMKKDVPDADVADSLHNDVITRLRDQMLEIKARADIWSARYGANHLATINLRTQVEELRKAIRDELGRIAQSYRSDYEIAKAHQEELEQNVNSLVAVTQVTNREFVGLHELESTAKTYHTVYDTFLQHYMEAIQQESFPITEARVISPASTPSGRSRPKPLIVLAIAASLGLALSFAAATLREAMDRVFRTTRQVEGFLGIDCLAILPLLQKTGSALPTAAGGKKKLAWLDGSPPTDNRTDRDQRIAVSSGAAVLRHVIEEPLSTFAELLRSIKVAADIGGVIKDNRVLGVTSTLPREGKSTVASNLAQLTAHAGKRVILIDGDLRNPSLTRTLAANAKVGLLEVLNGKVDIHDALYRDELSRLSFLPAVIGGRLAHSNEVLASDAFKRLIDGLRKSYDYVIVDFPPLLTVVDVRATINVIDSYLYVIEWGKTPMNIVQRELGSAPGLSDRIMGVVLNKANTSAVDRYEYQYGRYDYNKYSSR